MSGATQGAAGGSVDAGRQGGRRDEQAGIDEHEVLDAGEPSQRPGTERAQESPGDRGARAERKQPFGLTGVEDRAGDRPDERAENGALDVDGQPRDREDDGHAGHYGQAQDNQDRGQAGEEAYQERSPPESSDRRTEGDRDHEADQPERDVDVGEEIGPDPAQEQGVSADLAEPSSGLDRREQRGHEHDQAAFTRPDRQKPDELIHGLVVP